MDLPPGRGMSTAAFISHFLDRGQEDEEDQELHEIAVRANQMRHLSTPGAGALNTTGLNAQTLNSGENTGSPRALLDLPPEVMLQAVVTLGEKTTEGDLIEAVTVPWFEIVRWMKRDPQAMYQFDWRRWEEIIAGAYKADGFDVTLTPRSNDGGRDVIATRCDVGSIRFFDQVKAYAPGRFVLADDVRAMLGVLAAEPNVSKGIVTTTSDFAPGVWTDPHIQQFTPNRLELRPKDKLIEWLDAIAKKPRG